MSSMTTIDEAVQRIMASRYQPRVGDVAITRLSAECMAEIDGVAHSHPPDHDGMTVVVLDVEYPAIRPNDHVKVKRYGSGPMVVVAPTELELLEPTTTSAAADADDEAGTGGE